MSLIKNKKGFFERVLKKYEYIKKVKLHLIRQGFSNVSKESVFRNPLLNAFAVSYLEKLDKNELLDELIQDLERPFSLIIKEVEKR